jgi:phosphohistidine phosphatase
MRRLMLLRHAKSDRPPGIADHDRPLNRRGRDEAPLIGTYLAHNGLVPDRVLCSTSERTRETWELVAGSLADAVPPASPSAAAPNALHAKAAGKKGGRSPKRPPVDFEERLYAAEPHTILALLRETPPKVHSLLIVGHNPGIHEAALALIASGDVEARERLHEKFPTSGLAVIDFALDEWTKLHARSGRLDRFITPRQLAVEPE